MKHTEYIRVGAQVSLLVAFRNGAHEVKHRREYPAGTKGKVVRRDRDMLELSMENPPGVVYADSIIRVHKTRVAHSVV